MIHMTDKTYANLSLMAISLMGIFTTIHHVYRLGLGLLIPFGVAFSLPTIFSYLYRQKGHSPALWAYGLINTLLFIGLSFFDGFLDHTFKLVGLEPVTFLGGSDVHVVDTLYSLWSPEAGHYFYEWTGIFSFILGTLALYFTYKFVRTQIVSVNQLLNTASA